MLKVQENVTGIYKIYGTDKIGNKKRKDRELEVLKLQLKHQAQELRRYKAQNERNQLEGLLTGGKPVARARVTRMGRKEKCLGETKNRTVENDSDSASDDGTENYEVEVQDFVWDTNEYISGYFRVRRKLVETYDTKTFLFDYPDEGLKFMYDNYLNDTKAIGHIEKAARGTYETKKIKKRSVISNFTNIHDYAKEKGWSSKIYNTIQRIEQLASYDRAIHPEPNTMTTIALDNTLDLVATGNTSTTKPITPTKKKSKKTRVCQHPDNHDWDQCDKGSYVTTGRLSGGLKCIGTRDGIILCKREFVATRMESEDGSFVHETIDFFHPTSKAPGYGCKICEQAMCKPCHDYYQSHDRNGTPKRRQHHQVVSVPV
jgi:hypothetical protein